MELKIPKISVSTIFAIIPILYFNSCTFEFIKHYSIVLPIVIACMFFWCIVLLKEGVAIYLKNILPMLGYLLILGVLFVLGGQSRVSVLQTDMMNTLYLAFFMFVFAIYSDNERKNDRAFILTVYFVDVAISCVYSIYRLIDDPNLSRLLSTGFYHSTQEANEARGVVSFGVVYGLVLIMIVLFSFIIREKKNRFVNIFLFVLFAVTLIFAQFMLAIILVVMGLLWFLFITNNNKNKNSKIRFLVIFFISIIALILSPFLLTAIAESDIFGYEIDARLHEILALLRGESLEGTDLMARFAQYFMSISAFVFSYGLGKVVFPGVSVGSHAQWLDGLGNYGLIYLLYIFALFSFARFVIKILPNEKAKKLYGLVFGIYAVMSITNTSTWAPITLSLCVLIPFLCLDRVKE